jgi:hypothetical protein
MSQHSINPAIVYVVFRASRKRQIKAQLAGKTQSVRYAHGADPGCSIDKSCNAELTLSWSPYLLKSNELGQRVSALTGSYMGTPFIIISATL